MRNADEQSRDQISDEEIHVVPTEPALTDLPPTPANPPPRASKREAALAYARRGWRVLPLYEITPSGQCACRKRPDAPGHKAGKHPRAAGGVKGATREEHGVLSLWRRWPNANIGIATGAGSGLVVLDVDPRSSGNESLVRLVREKGALPATVTAKTGGGGEHLYFAHPGDGKIPNRTPIPGYPGLDLKADGGYVVAPPGNHASGGQYEWIRSPETTTLAPCPAFLLDLALTPHEKRALYESRPWDGHIPASVQAILDREPYIRSRFDRDSSRLLDRSESGVDQSIATLLAKNSVPGPEIENAIRASRSRAQLPAKNSPYYAATVGKALAAATRDASRPAKTELKVSEDGKKKLLELAFTGDRLRAIRLRPERRSPLPEVLDPDPHLHLLVATPNTGKTSFALSIAQSWCQGEPPWPGPPPLPGTRALIVSGEQPVKRIDDLLRRFDHYRTRPDRDLWPDRTVIVARDPELPKEAEFPLVLEAVGLMKLRSMLAEARESDDPFGLLVLDSLSRLKPSNIEEVDNDAMTAWLDELEAIAQEFDVYILLIHHKGHSAEEHRSQPWAASRGASAIGAVASVVLVLERVNADPRHRRLRVAGNFVLDAEMTFEVAGDDAEPGEIRYFRPVDRFSAYDPVKLIGTEEISTNDLAWRLSGKTKRDGKNPPGSHTSVAGKLRDHWEWRGMIQVSDGPRGAKVMRLAPHLATSPRPRPAGEAKSGNPTSPTAPIEARGGGEVEGGSQAAESAESGGEVRAPSKTPRETR